MTEREVRYIIDVPNKDKKDLQSTHRENGSNIHRERTMHMCVRGFEEAIDNNSDMSQRGYRPIISGHGVMWKICVVDRQTDKILLANRGDTCGSSSTGCDKNIGEDR